VGGIGSCGRELCCSSWLTDFKSVNTNAARYQNLSINQTKLSGQCGRLKCCLNYELDTYMDALQFFPDDADMLEMERSRAFLVKKDIFKNLMWYTMPDSNKQYPLTIERVKKIKELNRQGVRPADLEPVEVITNKPKDIEPVYADVVGQISLKTLEKTSRKRRDSERGQQQGDKQGGNRQQVPIAPITIGGSNRQGGNRQQSNRQGDNKQQATGNRQQATGNRQDGNRQQATGNRQEGNRSNENRQGGNRQQGGGQNQQNRPQRSPQNRGPQNRQRPNDTAGNNNEEKK
jgi:hypothetical protein